MSALFTGHIPSAHTGGPGLDVLLTVEDDGTATLATRPPFALGVWTTWSPPEPLEPVPAEVCS